MVLRKNVVMSDEEDESDGGFEILGDPADHPESFAPKQETPFVDLTIDDSDSGVLSEINPEEDLKHSPATATLDDLFSDNEVDQGGVGGKGRLSVGRRSEGKRQTGDQGAEGKAGGASREQKRRKIARRAPSTSSSGSSSSSTEIKKQARKPSYRNQRRIMSESPSPSPPELSPSPPSVFGRGKSHHIGSGTSKRKRFKSETPSQTPSDRTSPSESTSSPSTRSSPSSSSSLPSSSATRSTSSSSSSGSSSSSSSGPSSSSRSSSSSSNSDLDDIDKEDRIAARRRQPTKGMIWVKKYADLRSQPGLAIIRPNVINNALATSRDMLDLLALEHVDLIHTIRDRLRRIHCYNIIWPVGVKIPNFTGKEIPKVRSIMKQLQTAQDYDGPALFRPVRPCRLCSSGGQIGQFRVQCVSDYSARDGCLVCHALKKQVDCCERMSSSNLLFVSSSLDVVEDERAAYDARSAEIEVLIGIAKSLKPFLQPRPHPPPTPVNMALRDYTQYILDIDGLEEAEEDLKAARADIGAENNTRSTDDSEERLDRALDGGRQLSWSTREVIEDEELAWKASENALISVSAIVDNLKQERNQEAGAFHSLHKLIHRLIAMFASGSPLSMAERDMRTSRRDLGKPRR